MSVTEISSDNHAERDRNTSAHENVGSTSFYSKKAAYLTPLERKKLKRFHCDISPPPQPEKVTKPKKLSSEKSVTKENKKLKKPKLKIAPHKSDGNKEQKSKLKSTNKKSNIDISPTVFLSRKDASIPIANRKFFKSLSLRKSSTVTCKSIMPVDMKAAGSVIHDRKRFKVEQKKDKKKRTTLTPTIHHILLSHKDSDSSTSISNTPSSQEDRSSETLLKKTQASTTDWVKSSFTVDGVNNKHILTNVSNSSSLNCSRNVSNEVNVASFSGCEDVLILSDESNLQESENETLNKKIISTSKIFYDIFNKTKARNIISSEQKSSPKTASNDSKKSKTFNPGDTDQMMLDAGQKDIGAKQCSTCSMIYHIANDQDEELHQKFHANYLANLKFPGWKREKVIGKFIDGRVVMVSYEDPAFMMKKVDDILCIVNRDLGFTNAGLPRQSEAIVLLFISMTARVIGCLIAEPITSAYPARFDEKSGKLIALQGIADKKVDENSKVKALCGVNRIWVDPVERRTKIASRMVDCLRCNFYYGYPISETDLAFLDPSIDGKRFAAKYNKGKQFLVYK